MKLSNKILLGFIVSIFSLAVFLNYYVYSQAEKIPKAYYKGSIDTTIVKGGFNSIVLDGYYSVNLVKSEADTIKMIGPDNFITKYTKLNIVNNTLTIKSIVDLSKYTTALQIEIKSRDLKSIKAINGSTLKGENYKGELIDLEIKDSSTVELSSVEFGQAKITASGNSCISLEKIGEVELNLKNNSIAVLNTDRKKIKGTVEKDAALIVNGYPFDKTEFNSIKSGGKK